MAEGKLGRVWNAQLCRTQRSSGVCGFLQKWKQKERHRALKQGNFVGEKLAQRLLLDEKGVGWVHGQSLQLL